MATSTRELSFYLDQILKPNLSKDYCPNGLQVEGKASVGKLLCAVTACQQTIDKAISWGADAILVHHGYFWKGEEQRIINTKKERLKKLLANDINLWAFHLPLDTHPTYGNNTLLANKLEITMTGQIETGDNPPLVLKGELKKSMTTQELCEHIEKALGRKPQIIEGHNRPIKSIAWCTGGAQDYIEAAALSGVDAYLSGEISERTFYSAKEMETVYISAGHHATEQFGVQALGQHLAENFDLEYLFFDSNNPV